MAQISNICGYGIVIVDFVINSFEQFYGTDWLGMLCQFIGMFLLARKNSRGFIVFSVGNASWILYALMTGSIPQVAANLVVMGFNIYGYWNWKRSSRSFWQRWFK